VSKKVKWSISGGFIVLVVAVLILQFVLPSNRGSDVAARFGVPSVQAAEPIGHIGSGKGAEAVEKACNADKYVFALFYRESNEQLATTAGLVESARKKISRKSEVVEINISDPTEKDIVNKFGASRAPMPLALVLAPNGAIMGGWPASQLADDSKLIEAVGTKTSEQTMKALQKKNMVALCVQSSKTSDNTGAMKGVEEFLKDPKYGSTTAVVKADPTDPGDAKFLATLGIDPNSATATTVLLAPPGSVIGTFQGATPKDKLVAAVQAAAAPKSGGCCPPGSGKTCGPTGTATPQRAPMTSKPMTTQPQVQVKQIPTPTAQTTSSAPTNKQGK
jgi:hypothetical protein